MSNPTDIPLVDQLLPLPNNRTLAYTTSGDPTSTTVVIFFHGVFGVGRTSSKSQAKVLEAKGVHNVSPTLPGWGLSSSRPKGVPYAVALAGDIAALLDHLYPSKPALRIYVAGGSYGTVPAQMIYGLPSTIFPYAPYVAGCLLLAPFSPFKYHHGYAKTLSLPNYVAVGPPTQWLPFNLVPRLFSVSMAGKLKTEESAEKFVRQLLFDKMEEKEKATFAEWRTVYGREEGELERDFAKNMVASVAQNWDGFLEVSAVLREDWGFDPAQLEAKGPILICASQGDKMADDGMARWLAEAYPNGHLKLSEGGGHISGLFELDAIWTAFLELAEKVVLPIEPVVA